MDTNQKGEILVYQNEKGETKIDVYMEDGTVWLNQASIAQLYQTTPQNITKHIKKIYVEGELDENRTCNYYSQVQIEGGRSINRKIKFYNLDMILAIGYRVRSNVGMQFRNWTSKILKEYMQKGFVMNYERLKNPKKFGDDYFDELLERMRLNINPYKYSVLLSSIRASIFEALESFGPLLAPYDPIRQQYPK